MGNKGISSMSAITNGGDDDIQIHTDGKQTLNQWNPPKLYVGISHIHLPP